MILAHLTWPEVDALDRDVVVVIPTGSLEQHGPHLPLLTDTLLATAASEGAERGAPEDCLLTPCLWLGASGHHLPFAGTLSHSFEGYIAAVQQVIRSLHRHGFHRFMVVNGHGGNQEPNGIALRELKEENPNLTLLHSGYFAFIPTEALQTLEGPLKGIKHACEAETSLMLHLHPELVKFDRAVDDGLEPVPPVQGWVPTWEEVSTHGALGFPSYAKAETGRVLYEAAVAGLIRQIQAVRAGIVFAGHTQGQ